MSVVQFGGEPFVLLFAPITFGPPARKKETDVLVNHWRKKKGKDFVDNSFFQLVIQRRKNVYRSSVYGRLKDAFLNFESNRNGSNLVLSMF